MCVSFLTKFYDHIGKDASDMVKTEAALMKFCKKASGKDESFVSQVSTHVRGLFYIYLFVS